MVRVIYDKKFEKTLSRIKDNTIKNSVKNKIKKIIENPEIGKPMMYHRKGTRELYVGSFRLSYRYLKDENFVEILDLYHKDEQ